MIDDLLDVSRITHNKIELRKNQTELVSILKGAAELSRRHLQGRGQTLDFPIPEEPIYLEADETRLEQAFGNLSGESLPWGVLDHPQHSTEPEVRQTEALNDLKLANLPIKDHLRR
jgi:signal transduction histidine kinase